MKAILLMLLMPLAAFSQTDSTSRDSIKAITIPDAVIVSSTRANDNSPTTFQVISKQELEKNNLGQDLPFLLDMTPSVVTTSDAGTGIGYTGIRIRGSDATRVNATLNGIPINDAASQTVYWVDLPDVVSSAQNIQIQRGIGTSTNGPGAFGGTVSLQTQTPAEKAFGETNISGGSFQTMKLNAKFGTGMIKDKFFIEGSGTYITSNGNIERGFAHLGSWFFQTGYRYKNTLIKALYFGGREKTYQAWDGVPEDSLKVHRTYNELGTEASPPYPNQTDNYGQDYFQLLFAQQLPKHFYLNLGLFATLGRGYYEEYHAAQDFQGSYFPNYDSAITTDLVRQKWLKNIFYGGTFAVNYEHKNISATVGGLFGQFVGQNFGKVISAPGVPNLDSSLNYYYSPSTKNDFTVYAKFNYELLQKVNFYADLQYRYVSYTTNGMESELDSIDIKTHWHFFNPKVGVLYKIKPQHHVFASFAVGNREPNRDDILANTVNLPKAEQMYDVELGYRSKFDIHDAAKVWLNLNYYLMYYKDQLVLSGQLNDVGNPIKINVPVSYRTGIELNGRFLFNTRKGRDIFSINYAFTYSINKIKSFNETLYTYDENYNVTDTVINHKNTHIAFSPDIIASLELAVYPVKGLSISLMNKFVGKQYLDNTSSEDRKLKPFYYSNINISYTVGLGKPGKEITFKLLLNNIFNHLYESNGATYPYNVASTDPVTHVQTVTTYPTNYYFPQAGFNVLAGASVRF